MLFRPEQVSREMGLKINLSKFQFMTNRFLTVIFVIISFQKFHKFLRRNEIIEEIQVPFNKAQLIIVKKEKYILLIIQYWIITNKIRRPGNSKYISKGYYNNNAEIEE